jgi:hypothetical protein
VVEGVDETRLIWALWLMTVYSRRTSFIKYGFGTETQADPADEVEAPDSQVVHSFRVISRLTKGYLKVYLCPFDLLISPRRAPNSPLTGTISAVWGPFMFAHRDPEPQKI